MGSFPSLRSLCVLCDSAVNISVKAIHRRDAESAETTQRTKREFMTQPSNKSEIAAAYDEWAETYDTDANRTRDLAGKVLREAQLDLSGRNIIEIGCGTGRNTEWLTRPEAGSTNIVALDFSEEMLARARARVHDPRVRFIQHDVRARWPLADATADIVIVMLVLEHVEDLQPIFAEAARTLKPNGELFLCELHPTRQLMGKQAQYTSTKTGQQTLVPAVLHKTEDYLNTALSGGFELINQGDWRDEDTPADNPPRLLSLRFCLT
jgi:ubiquinone/menaquinone biosynthesis C-methylase UbiE